ncbi:MAG: SAM-dependent methyltransferase [Citromicrobium sp.]|nr:SAM-dependent methyltransferase [Citromicrobium sp.]MAS84395.1 SAM-dependent methyltransferase [Erythrobacteraceae bacterium]MBT47175.1 SAM-dependent methyltransferase [Citromicrobium sp.]|tara:strand:- start:1103 stop:2359 length:1257 start_codon:yes stop_codon:yes gene_type:complete
MAKAGSEVPGLPARRAALRLLDGVLRRGETLEQNETAALRGLPAPDAGLARAIAAETLRWLVNFDALIDSVTREVLPDDAKSRTVLRLMLAQWLRLDTPPHAVVATALPLLSGGPKRLAHGVFGALTKRGVELPAAPTLPEAVGERWGERAGAIAGGLAEPPPLDLTLRDPAQTAEWAVKFGADSLMPGHLRLSRGQAVHGLEGFEDGAWWVQDLAASLPARLLGEGGGKRALDLCAAPGGKTLQLAAQGWQVTALDISAKRLKLLEENLKRTGLEAEVIAADAFKWEPPTENGAKFDAILIDAPCTATGTARRHPDVLHRIGPRQIEQMAEVQARLIERASGWLTPGGMLVYAVCSLESDEGEDQAEKVWLPREPISAEELPAGLSPTAHGTLRTDPGMLPEHGGLDGFFIARWRNS